MKSLFYAIFLGLCLGISVFAETVTQPNQTFQSERDVRLVSLSPNGRYALSASRDVEAWSVDSGQKLYVFSKHDDDFFLVQDIDFYYEICSNRAFFGV